MWRVVGVKTVDRRRTDDLGGGGGAVDREESNLLMGDW